MGTTARYVAKAEAGLGWRIWDRRLKRSWGNYVSHYPDELLAELNGAGRPEVITSLSRESKSKNHIERRGWKKRS